MTVAVSFVQRLTIEFVHVLFVAVSFFFAQNDARGIASVCSDASVDKKQGSDVVKFAGWSVVSLVGWLVWCSYGWLVVLSVCDWRRHDERVNGIYSRQGHWILKLSLAFRKNVWGNK